MILGIGSFTIVDNGNVTNQDLGNNFFVTFDSVGKPRATVCCELLQELNSDVSGNFLVEVESLVKELKTLIFVCFFV